MDASSRHASSTLTVGEVVSNDRAFTTPIGTTFLPGERFEVEIVGRSSRCRHIGTGSVVWIRGSANGAQFVSA